VLDEVRSGAGWWPAALPLRACSTPGSLPSTPYATREVTDRTPTLVASGMILPTVRCRKVTTSTLRRSAGLRADSIPPSTG